MSSGWYFKPDLAQSDAEIICCCRSIKWNKNPKGVLTGQMLILLWLNADVNQQLLFCIMCPQNSLLKMKLSMCFAYYYLYVFNCGYGTLSANCGYGPYYSFSYLCMTVMQLSFNLMLKGIVAQLILSVQFSIYSAVLKSCGNTGYIHCCIVLHFLYR